MEKVTGLAPMFTKKRGNILVILDDVVAQIAQNLGNPMLTELFYNRRNIVPNCTISYLITTQKFNLFPLRLRTVLTSVCIFAVTPSEISSITKELVYVEPKRIESYLQSLADHEFIYIRLNPYLICRNFKPVFNRSTIASSASNLAPPADNDLVAKKQIPNASISASEQSQVRQSTH